MAHIFVKNSLSNLKSAKLNVNIPKYVTTESKGDPIWLLEIATTYPSASGTRIRPSYINQTTTFEELDSSIANAVSEISSQIDWEPLINDDAPPYIEEYGPKGLEVSIASNINIEIKDKIPSAGIDLSDAQILINPGDTDIDITDECFVEGTPFYYNIRWEPAERKTERYE